MQPVLMTAHMDFTVTPAMPTGSLNEKQSHLREVGSMIWSTQTQMERMNELPELAGSDWRTQQQPCFSVDEEHLDNRSSC